MSETPNVPAPAGQILIYHDGATRLQVRLEGRTVWLTQRLMAELYQVSVPTINEHLASIYAEGELDREATIRSFRIVQREGARDVTRQLEHYALDAILAVGYRVRSARGTVYLTQEELTELNRIVSMYLDFAEDQARRKKAMHMAEWVARLDAFLEFNERNILTHAGRVSHQLAEEHAHGEFEKYETERRQLESSHPPSDFDKAVEHVKRLESPPAPKKPRAKRKQGKKT